MAIKKNGPGKGFKIQPEPPKKKVSYSVSGGGSQKSSSFAADMSYQITPRLSASTSLYAGSGKPSGQISLTYKAPIKRKKKS
jgi:hypothetical protein